MRSEDRQLATQSCLEVDSTVGESCSGDDWRWLRLLSSVFHLHTCDGVGEEYPIGWAHVKIQVTTRVLAFFGFGYSFWLSVLAFWFDCLQIGGERLGHCYLFSIRTYVGSCHQHHFLIPWLGKQGLRIKKGLWKQEQAFIVV